MEIRQDKVDHPSAWTSASVGGKSGFVRFLTETQLSAIDELLAKTADVGSQDVTQEQFDHPGITPFLAEVWNEVMHGRGVVIIAGLSPERYSAEQLERIYCGFGVHWGKLRTQSAMGDKLGRVTAGDASNLNSRAYRTTEELFMHTDANEIVGLLCIDRAEAGGLTRLASAIEIHNRLLVRQPALLPSLYEGYHYSSREKMNSSEPVTPYKIPVYCYIDGVLSCRYNGEFIDRAGELAGSLPADLVAARAAFHEIADEIQAQFMLEPGEMMILNNFTTLHARTNFEDSATHKRNLLRLWLDVAEGRKVLPVFRQQALTYDPNDERLKMDASAL